MKILVVDDSISITNLIRDILSPDGFEVQIASNGAEALDKYAKFRPDLVTLDISMPIMDGYETLTRILKLDKNAKIIMLSVAEHWSLIERCFARGAIGYLPKPFTSDELLSTIKNPYIYDDKNAITFLTITSNRITNALQKILGQDTSLCLLKVELISQENSPYHLSPSSNFSQIRVVQKIIEPLQMQIPQNSIGYVMEFVGQQNGTISAFVKNEDMIHLSHISSDYFSLPVNEADKSIEFFNIILTKFFSSMIEMSHHILNKEMIRAYDKTIDMYPSSSQAIKAIFEIRTKILKIPIEIQLWSDIKQILGKRF